MYSVVTKKNMCDNCCDGLATASGSSSITRFPGCGLYLSAGVLLSGGSCGRLSVFGGGVSSCGRRLRSLLPGRGLDDLRDWEGNPDFFIGGNEGDVAGNDIHSCGDMRDIGCNGHRDVGFG